MLFRSTIFNKVFSTAWRMFFACFCVFQATWFLICPERNDCYTCMRFCSFLFHCLFFIRILKWMARKCVCKRHCAWCILIFLSKEQLEDEKLVDNFSFWSVCFLGCSERSSHCTCICCSPGPLPNILFIQLQVCYIYTGIWYIWQHFFFFWLQICRMQLSKCYQTVCLF